MTATTLTLADFLSARLDEDEARAQDAQVSDDRPWEAGRAGHTPTMRFLGVNDPARALADVAAKRKILALHDDRGWDLECEHEVRNNGCPTTRCLASVYADHPDFRDDWRWR